MYYDPLQSPRVIKDTRMALKEVLLSLVAALAVTVSASAQTPAGSIAGRKSLALKRIVVLVIC